MDTSAANVSDLIAIASPAPKSFSDFPVEVRLQIFRWLFKGKVVGLEWRLLNLRHVQAYLANLDPDTVLNILLASKACFAEAKPVLMTTAVFKVSKKPSIYQYPQHRGGGLPIPQLAMIRSIKTSQDHFGRWQRQILSNLPHLQDVTIEGIRLPLAGSVQSDNFQDDMLWRRVIFSLRNEWRRYSTLFQHVKPAAERNTRTQDRARFMLVADLDFHDDMDTDTVSQRQSRPTAFG